MLDLLGCVSGIALEQPEEDDGIYWAASGALPLSSQKKMSEENSTSIAATIEEWVGKNYEAFSGGERPLFKVSQQMSQDEIMRQEEEGTPFFQSLPTD